VAEVSRADVIFPISIPPPSVQLPPGNHCGMATPRADPADPGSYVDSVLAGYVALHAGVLRYARDGEARSVFRRTSDDARVALLSGGGSGHEPAHAGFVGAGLLSGAVCGSLFASPSSSSVLRAILETAPPAGVLLIVKNYTGDRLNFGLAAERARALGVAVRVVVVGDDAALPPNPVAGRRGLAGTLFVHKIAGAAAAAGLSLDQVWAEASAAAGAVATVGVSLSLATLPGATPALSIPAGMMDVGGGIHGEAGAEQLPLRSTRDMVSHIIARLLDNPHGQGFPPGCRVAVLINSLGATPPGELAVVGGAALAQLREAGIRVVRAYCGALMTSLDARGVSISLLAIHDDTMLDRLDAPTEAPAWPRALSLPDDQADIPCSLAVEPEHSVSLTRRQGPPTTPLGRAFGAAIPAAAAAIAALESQLDAWDAVAGDGDTGSTLARGARAVLDDLPSYNLDNHGDAWAGLAASVRRAVGGTSGALLDACFTAAEAQARSCPADGPGAAFEAGVLAISRVGGAAPGMRTMLDALVPAVAACRAAGGTAAAAADAAAAGAEATRTMAARAGRASYVAPAALRAGDTPDPGAAAVAVALRAIADALLSVRAS
jgi:dihydroxyacetone kinase